MKTKLHLLAGVAFTLAFTSASYAKVTDLNDSHKNAILGTTETIKFYQNVKLNDMLITNTTFVSPTKEATSENNGITDNTESMLSYHHSSSGSDGDGIQGKNIFSFGVGFVSITGVLTSAYTSLGYSVSSIPPLTLSYVRGLSSHFGFGLQIAYTSFTLSLNNVSGDPIYNGGNAYTYSDKLTLSGIGFGLVGTYSFITSGKIDPYFGFGVGYEKFSFSWSTTDPHAGSDIFAGQDGNVNPGTISGGLPWINLLFGCRFFFTDHFGAYADLGWHGLVGGVINVGLTAKF